MIIKEIFALNLIRNLFQKVNTETFKSGVASRGWLIWCGLKNNH